MFKALLYTGLVATAFMTLPGVDLREIKMATALCFAMALCVAEFYTKGLKPNKNIWVILILVYIPIAAMFAPSPRLDMLGVDCRSFWYWQPAYKIIIFSLMFFAISSHEFEEKDLKILLHVIVWCAFFTALYQIGQMFWMDQFFNLNSEDPQGRISGFIANPTLSAPFVCMSIPIAIYLKNWVKLPILVIGTIIPDSQIAWIALVVGVLVYFALKGKKWFWYSLLVAGVLIGLLGSYLLLAPKIQNAFDQHERLFHYKQIFKDCIGPIAADQGINNKAGLTGRGIGSFRYLYHAQHPGTIVAPNRFIQAHNDYLEFLYGAGFVGLSLKLAAIFFMLKINVWKPTPYQRALLASFSVSAFTAFGTFIWQIGTTAFLTVVICGLLHNERKICCVDHENPN